MKYKQRGYRDGEAKRDKTRISEEERAAREQARKVRHAISRDARVVIRCADCGYQTPDQVEILVDTSCPKCHSAWHNCRNCRHFDTSARFECRQPIEKRIASKTVANMCDEFEARAVLDATGRRAEQPKSADPRAAFDALFKK